jgi:predicted phosphate transport protein (TIGR00153 family)
LFPSLLCPEDIVRLLPRDVQFYELFVEVANHSVEAAGELKKLFHEPPDRRRPHVDAIKRLEHRADEITHEVANRIDQTFVTPIDREDIHALASALDDVMDAIDSIARRTEIYRLGTPPAGVLEMVDLITSVTEVLAKGVQSLRKGKVMPYCTEAKKLEEEGDAVYHRSLGDLFDREKDPIEVIKWKEVYDALEFTLDEADDVANLLESITLKNG